MANITIPDEDVRHMRYIYSSAKRDIKRLKLKLNSAEIKIHELEEKARELRKQIGISELNTNQTYLSEKFGVSPSYVRKIINYQIRPDVLEFGE